jgi:hypothetical protein
MHTYVAFAAECYLMLMNQVSYSEFYARKNYRAWCCLFFLWTFIWLFRRTNELKSDIDIPDDVIMEFNQFWSDFKGTPLKGKNCWSCTLWIISVDHRCISSYQGYIEYFLFILCSSILWDYIVSFSMLLPVLTSDLLSIYPGRNAILQGICPQVFGLFTVKLAGLLLSHISSHTYLFVLQFEIAVYGLRYLKVLVIWYKSEKPVSCCFLFYLSMSHRYLLYLSHLPFFLQFSCINTYWRCATCWCFWDKGSRRVLFAAGWWSR